MSPTPGKKKIMNTLCNATEFVKRIDCLKYKNDLWCHTRGDFNGFILMKANHLSDSPSSWWKPRTRGKVCIYLKVYHQTMNDWLTECSLPRWNYQLWQTSASSVADSSMFPQSKPSMTTLSAVSAKVFFLFFRSYRIMFALFLIGKITPFTLSFFADGDEVTSSDAFSSITNELANSPGGIVGFSLDFRQRSCGSV